MNLHEWDYTPISPHLFGDEGPWTWKVPTLWRALADPEGPWAPPPAPWLQEIFGQDQLAQNIAYWAPLLTLTYGVLGWARPDVGVTRWLEEGRPTDEPALAVLDRWWGGDAIALAAWAQQGGMINGYSERIAKLTDSKVGPAAPPTASRSHSHWAPLTEGGGDPLHLGHVFDHLFSEHHRDPAGRLLHSPPSSENPAASLVLSTYGGWYGALSRLGAQLPARADKRSWQVDVTAAPLGYLGRYRMSRVTGRWFSGRHRWHALGWTV
jgi:hypothetical protein